MYIDDDQFYINPFLATDKGYTYETAAYADLSDFQGFAIPQYYGSYSVDIPLEPTEDKRHVRLILIELIPGLSMQKADPDQFTQKVCQNIMKSIIEFDTLVYARNVLLKDLYPKNVMVTADSRAVFIDFADADIGGGALFAQSMFKSFEFHFGNYVPPLLRWHEDQNREDAFGDWIDWDWQPWLQAEFANKHGRVNHTRDATILHASAFYLEDGKNVAEGLRMVVGC